MYFELFNSVNKQWRWRLKTSNGKIIANSGESYKNRIDCLSAIQLVCDTDSQTELRVVKK